VVIARVAQHRRGTEEAYHPTLAHSPTLRGSVPLSTRRRPWEGPRTTLGKGGGRGVGVGVATGRATDGPVIVAVLSASPWHCEGQAWM
jgi:hypothetical protein